MLVNQSPHHARHPALAHGRRSPRSAATGRTSTTRPSRSRTRRSRRSGSGTAGSGRSSTSLSQKPGIYTKVHVHGSNGASVGVETDRGPTFIAGVSAIAEPPLNDLWTVPGEEAPARRSSRPRTAPRFAALDATTHYHALQIRDFLRADPRGPAAARDRRGRPGRRRAVHRDLPVRPRGPGRPPAARGGIVIRFCFALAGLVVVGTAFAQDKPVAADPRLVVELVRRGAGHRPPDRHGLRREGPAARRREPHALPAREVQRAEARPHSHVRGHRRRRQGRQFTTFFEGTTHTMDVAVHPDGSVYVATRNEILRLRDTEGRRARPTRRRASSSSTRPATTRTTGSPGSPSTSKGDLNFGMGENLGADYKLIGADGTTLTGGGEGRQRLPLHRRRQEAPPRGDRLLEPVRLLPRHLRPALRRGQRPRRVAAVPAGARRRGRRLRLPVPLRPCRAGTRSRRGTASCPARCRTSAGTGESPCEVVAYESDGLPAEYRGNLLVPAWADHRVERYVLQPKRRERSRPTASRSSRAARSSGRRAWRSRRTVRCSSATGCSQSYELHGKGAIWHVRWKDDKPAPRPTDPKQAILSCRPRRPARRRRGRWPSDEAGRAFLRGHLAAADVRVRAAALTALIDVGDKATDLAAIARADPEPRAAGDGRPRRWSPAARTSRSSCGVGARRPCGPRRSRDCERGGRVQPARPAARRPDPYLRHAAVHRLSQLPELLAEIDPGSAAPTRRHVRRPACLAWRRARTTSTPDPAHPTSSPTPTPTSASSPRSGCRTRS